ncbi:hypothetical protein SD81_035945 [Tolypothrix campylonemoides VB511288]|nr:hypothetical protein SD81_035945 [Tolypothrix campylonemoides VB511288]
MTARLLALALAIALAACQPGVDREAAAAAAREQAAETAAAQFDTEVANGNWEMAAAHGAVLLLDHPQSQAVAKRRAQIDEAKAKGDAMREERRLASLWAYGAEPVAKGTQLSAAIYSKERVDPGTGTAAPVRLIFRDHPEWGRSSYLVLDSGDFDCYGGCRVSVTVDDAAPRRMAASRPDTDEAIAMFIEDERALWRIAKDARTIAIAFPVKAGGTRTATYEVAGLDPAKLPAWN